MNKLDRLREFIRVQLLGLRYRRPDIIETFHEGGTEGGDVNAAADEIAGELAAALRRERLKQAARRGKT